MFSGEHPHVPWQVDETQEFLTKFLPGGITDDNDSSGRTFYQHAVTPIVGAVEPKSTHEGPVTTPYAVNANEVFWLCRKESQQNIRQKSLLQTTPVSGKATAVSVMSCKENIDLSFFLSENIWRCPI